MKHSELSSALAEVFGGYAASLSADLVLNGLGSRTADQALADGVPPRQVWDAICDEKDLPDDVRWWHRREHKRR